VCFSEVGVFRKFLRDKSSDAAQMVKLAACIRTVQEGLRQRYPEG
jgi:hypothetical protein